MLSTSSLGPRGLIQVVVHYSLFLIWAFPSFPFPNFPPSPPRAIVSSFRNCSNESLLDSPFPSLAASFLRDQCRHFLEEIRRAFSSTVCPRSFLSSHSLPRIVALDVKSQKTPFRRRICPRSSSNILTALARDPIFHAHPQSRALL